MAIKKASLDFSTQNISFKKNDETIKILSLNLNNMNVEILLEEGGKKKVRKMPFAHLPKEIKKVLRPL